MQPAVLRYDSVSSTNSVAQDLALDGCPDWTVVQAVRQHAGRGRLSRQFQSPVGGLYMSAVLRPDLPPESLSLVTIAAGLACAEAIQKCFGVGVELKWPNDLYLHSRKLGGILTEAAPFSTDDKHGSFIVIGIGINVNTSTEAFPPELQDVVTSLYDEQKSEYDIDVLLSEIVGQLQALVPLLVKNPDKVLERWRRRDYLMGRKIKWLDAAAGYWVHGTGNGLLPDGCYQLITEDGTSRSILAGDIVVDHRRI